VAGVIADTHAIIWYLLDSPRLSAPALAQFEACRTEGVTIGVASISIVEAVIHWGGQIQQAMKAAGL
jgi:PIN domain nuclease of toxin-antitoxin system